MRENMTMIMWTNYFVFDISAILCLCQQHEQGEKREKKQDIKQNLKAILLNIYFAEMDQFFP